MGLQKTINLSGKVANLIFYEFRGTHCIRTMPDEVKQTAATKNSASRFGLAASMSKALREGLLPLLPDPKDKKMMYRMNAVLAQWLGSKDMNKKPTPDTGLLNDFQLNDETALRERLKKSLTVDWTKKKNIILELPALIPVKDITPQPPR